MSQTNLETFAAQLIRRITSSHTPTNQMRFDDWVSTFGDAEKKYLTAACEGIPEILFYDNGSIAMNPARELKKENITLKRDKHNKAIVIMHVHNKPGLIIKNSDGLCWPVEQSTEIKQTSEKPKKKSFFSWLFSRLS